MSTHLPQSFVRGLRIEKRAMSGPLHLAFRTTAPLFGVVRDLKTGHSLTDHPVASTPMEPGLVQMDFTSALGRASGGEALLYLFLSEGDAKEHHDTCKKCDVEKEPTVRDMLKRGLMPEVDEKLQERVREATKKYREEKAAAEAALSQRLASLSTQAAPRLTFQVSVRASGPGNPPEWEPD